MVITCSPLFLPYPVHKVLFERLRMSVRARCAFFSDISVDNSVSLLNQLVLQTIPTPMSDIQTIVGPTLRTEGPIFTFTIYTNQF